MQLTGVKYSWFPVHQPHEFVWLIVRLDGGNSTNTLDRAEGWTTEILHSG